VFSAVGGACRGVIFGVFGNSYNKHYVNLGLGSSVLGLSAGRFLVGASFCGCRSRPGLDRLRRQAAGVVPVRRPGFAHIGGRSASGRARVLRGAGWACDLIHVQFIVRC